MYVCIYMCIRTYMSCSTDLNLLITDPNLLITDPNLLITDLSTSHARRVMPGRGPKSCATRRVSGAPCTLCKSWTHTCARTTLIQLATTKRCASEEHLCRTAACRQW